MFQFPGLASAITRMAVLQTAGLSHSETRGSTAVCAYPRIIAAYHVLHRLQEPRHPPYALTYLPVRYPDNEPRKGTRRDGRLYWACTSFALFTFLLFRLCNMSWNNKRITPLHVENIGFEPMASCMPCKRSSQLS